MYGCIALGFGHIIPENAQYGGLFYLLCLLGITTLHLDE